MYIHMYVCACTLHTIFSFKYVINYNKPVLEIRIRNWSAVFLKIGCFTGYYTAVPLKMYGKLAQ